LIAALIITFFCQRHALYKVCDFYKHQDLGLLFGRNDICANDFNDDCLARDLDRLEESEFHELYGLILVNVRKVYQFHPDNFGISEELKVQAWRENNWQDVGQIAQTKGTTTYRIQEFPGEIAGKTYRFIVANAELSIKLDTL
jgi:hypothetical protein